MGIGGYWWPGLSIAIGGPGPGVYWELYWWVTVNSTVWTGHWLVLVGVNVQRLVYCQVGVDGC
jgi:hypothetical protein